MLFLALAVFGAGMFAGAALYVSTVEHPARTSLGSAPAIHEFGPSYAKGKVWQIAYSMAGALCAAIAGWQRDSLLCYAAALLLIAPMPYTIVLMLPVNKQLLDPSLDRGSRQAGRLLARWGALHWFRTGCGLGAFVLLIGAAAFA